MNPPAAAGARNAAVAAGAPKPLESDTLKAPPVVTDPKARAAIAQNVSLGAPNAPPSKTALVAPPKTPVAAGAPNPPPVGCPPPNARALAAGAPKAPAVGTPKLPAAA